MDQDKIDERRERVRKLVCVHGLSVSNVAELLGCSQQTVVNDVRIIKRRWFEKAIAISDEARKAHEEIECLRSLAESMMMEAEGASGAQMALFADIAAKCLFLAGRLKQGHDE